MQVWKWKEVSTKGFAALLTVTFRGIPLPHTAKQLQLYHATASIIKDKKKTTKKSAILNKLQILC